MRGVAKVCGVVFVCLQALVLCNVTSEHCASRPEFPWPCNEDHGRCLQVISVLASMQGVDVSRWGMPSVKDARWSSLVL